MSPVKKKTVKTPSWPKGKHPGGRPSKKTNLDFGMIETFYGFGLIDEQICKALDISVPTLETWKKDEKFFKAIKKGKEIADNRVVRSLYDRATGYSHREDDIRVVDGQIVITETVKHYPPDPTSMIFWLKNRKRAEWRDRQEVEHDIAGNLADLMRIHLAEKKR